MELTEEQINIICSYIPLTDIQEYINSHQREYEEFLKSENN